MGPDPYRFFRVEAAQLAEQLSRGVLLLEGGSPREHVPELLRAAHTLKGAARVVKHKGIAERAHALEEVAAKYRDQAEPVAREVVDALLEIADAIGAFVRELSLPVAAAPVAAPSPPQPREAPEDELPPAPAEADELEELVEGISEANVQVRSARGAAAKLERMRHLATLLSDHLEGAFADGAGSVRGAFLPKARSIAEELADLAEKAERAVTGGLEQTERELGNVSRAAERLRLVPASAMQGSLERTARDAARELGKQVTFSLVGGNVRLEAHALAQVRRALVQAVRNAVAHGIELPSERESSGKPAAGTVRVRILRRGGRVGFVCEDDGHGIDLESVRLAAVRAGAISGDAALDRAALVGALLKGGLTTTQVATQTSGRGIGLDLVRETAARLGGEVTLDTAPGRGTTLELVVPISRSSLDALLVEASGTRAAIPLEAIGGALRLSEGDVMRTAEGESIIHAGRVIPLHALICVLTRRPSPGRRRAASSAVLVRSGAAIAAIAVERLIGTETIVMRGLPELASTDPVVLGASLDVDGLPQLVLDPDALVAAALAERGIAPAQPETPRLPILIIDDSLTTRMLEQSILESAGYEVALAASAEEALEKAARLRYGLFLVDVEMPGMDGFSFVEKTRADPSQKGVPAILVSSRNSPSDLARGREVGASAYVVKGDFDQRRLLDTIRELVAQ